MPGADLARLAGADLGFAALVMVGARTAYPFLAVTDPLPGGVLVVEGWASDPEVEMAIAEVHRNHYDKVFVTGIPVERGSPFSEYKTFAELGAIALRNLGLDRAMVQAVPAPRVSKDRTYSSAVSLKQWWREHGMAPTRVNLVTSGAHARRSRLLFQKALGKGVAVGVIAVGPEDYDEKHWWRSSQGFRTVTGEVLAYGYARFLFRAAKE